MEGDDDGVLTMTRVRLLRPWNTRAGLHHPPEIIEVPDAQARGMASAVPPYAEIVDAPQPVKRAKRKASE